MTQNRSRPNRASGSKYSQRIKPKDRRELIKAMDQRGGLTSVDIAQYTRAFQCQSSCVTKLMIERGCEFLQGPSEVVTPEPVPPSDPTNWREMSDPRGEAFTTDTLFKEPVETAEFVALQEALAECQADQASSQRAKMQAEAETAKARKAVAQAAQLRKDTAAERQSLADTQHRLRAAQRALQLSQAEVMALNQENRNPAEFYVPYAPLDDLRDLAEALMDEMARRKLGGRVRHRDVASSKPGCKINLGAVAKSQVLRTG